MPIFEIEVDGRTYEAEAPDAASAVAAIKKMSAGTPQPSVPMDMAKSAGSGAVKGAAGLLGLPRGVMDVLGGAGDAVAQAPGRLYNRFVGDGTWSMPESAVRAAAEADKRSLNADVRNVLPSKNDVVGAIEENVTGPLYKPQTRAGRYAETVTDFAVNAAAMPAGGGSAVVNALRYGVAPGIASEAAGQATEGTKYEPYARTAAALGTVGVAAALSRPAYAERLVGRSAQDITPQQFAEAERLMRDAQARGIQLTPAEAIQQVSGGASRLGDVQRIAESTIEGGNKLSPFFAKRPEQVQAAGREVFDRSFGARSAAPSYQGVELQKAAQGALDNIRQRINKLADPYYNKLPSQRIDPADLAALKSDPSYVRALEEVRSNPELNASIANLGDDSIAVVNEVSKRLDRNATAAQQTVMNPQGDNRLAAVRGDAKRETDLTAGGASSDYRDARSIVSSGRQNVLDPLEAGPVGKIAATTNPADQAAALMPRSPLPGSEAETARAAQLLMQQNPQAAQGVVRGGIEQTFNRTAAATDTAARPDQFGGARFAREIRGDPQRNANIVAALEKTAGPAAVKDVDRLLDVLSATGWRQRQGSLTAFNTDVMRELERGGVQSVGRAVTKPASTVSDAISRARLGSQSETLADLMMSGPEGLRRVQELAARGDDRARIVLQLLAADQAASR